MRMLVEEDGKVYEVNQGDVDDWFEIGKDADSSVTVLRIYTDTYRAVLDLKELT